MSWDCTKCGQKIEDQFGECWQCDIESRECPECKSACNPDAGICPDCSYDFNSKKDGVRSLDFAFPEVSHSYKSSGKTTLYAIALMSLLAISIAVIGGFVAAIMTLLAGALLGTVISLVSGILIVIAIGVGNKVGKNRNIWTSTIITGISGIIAWVISSSVILSLNVFIIINFVFLVIVPVGAVYSKIKELPFCELCNQFMRNIKVNKYPISHEKLLLENFENNKYDLKKLQPAAENDLNICEISVDLCDACKNGYIHVHSTLRRSSSKKKPRSETKRTFSSPISESSIDLLLESSAKE